MAYEKRNGDISIFKNNKKTEGSKQPDYQGELLTPDGEILQVSLWVKEGKSGKFFAGMVKPPFSPQAQTKVNPQAPTRLTEEESDSLPF